MGRTTRYGYDALSRQVSISNPAIQGSPLLQPVGWVERSDTHHVKA
jgi:hypothetical protein